MKEKHYKLLIFNCYGGCATGVAASRACIRIWEENQDDIKIGCLPAVIVPWKLKEIIEKSEKRILIDACGIKCGARLIEKEGLKVDRYIELTSLLGIRKQKVLPSKDLDEEVYIAIKEEVDTLLARKTEIVSTEKMQKREDTSEILLKPVGVVRNEAVQPSLIVKSGDLDRRPQAGRQLWRTQISDLIIDASLIGILDGIEDFSHLLVIYWAHRIPPEGRSLIKTHPMGRKDLPLVGIFSTCSPARPNNICAMVVRLLERKENVLKVEGLDSLDGSPILDIKPYIPSYYHVDNVKIAQWLLQIEREFTESPTTSNDEKDTR